LTICWMYWVIIAILQEYQSKMSLFEPFISARPSSQ
jgi:hypothetical protein